MTTTTKAIEDLEAELQEWAAGVEQSLRLGLPKSARVALARAKGCAARIACRAPLSARARAAMGIAAELTVKVGR